MNAKLILGIVAAALIGALVLGGTVTAAPDSADDRVIHVSGTGKVTTSPDRVLITVGVETEHPDAKVAQQENAARMSAVISSLKGLGIPERSIQTSGYSMYSKTTDDGSPFGAKQQRVYVVHNNVVVTLDDVTRAGEVIDTAVMDGANQINSVRFTLSDEKSQQLRSDALHAAVTQARGDADAVADALGVRILGIKEVSVGGSYTPVVYAEEAVYRSMDSAAYGVPTPIEAGTIDVTATVSVTYFI
ncbi:MAG TPA: DUF541 domain-containing protein [Methanoculleus sp.]|nr:DUF541 domain-containing protein [Methanoculleus sp.]